MFTPTGSLWEKIILFVPVTILTLNLFFPHFYKAWRRNWKSFNHLRTSQYNRAPYKQKVYEYLGKKFWSWNFKSAVGKENNVRNNEMFLLLAGPLKSRQALKSTLMQLCPKDSRPTWACEVPSDPVPVKLNRTHTGPMGEASGNNPRGKNKPRSTCKFRDSVREGESIVFKPRPFPPSLFPGWPGGHFLQMAVDGYREKVRQGGKNTMWYYSQVESQK